MVVLGGARFLMSEVPMYGPLPGEKRTMGWFQQRLDWFGVYMFEMRFEGYAIKEASLLQRIERLISGVGVRV